MKRILATVVAAMFLVGSVGCTLKTSTTEVEFKDVEKIESTGDGQTTVTHTNGKVTTVIQNRP